MLDRLRHEDDGFTLVETLAAMIVFAILAVSVGGTIIHLFRLTEDNTARVVAGNLATEQIEAVRAKRALDVPDGAVQITPKPVVNGTEYTITRTANYVAEGSSTSLCETGSGSTKLAYKLVTVNVTWPNMGAVKPVRQDTLLSLGIGFDGVDTSKGTIAVGIKGGAGEPQGGVLVTLNPGSLTSTTGGDGCAVFSKLQPGTSYTATLNQVGYVGTSGARRVDSSPASVTASGITRVAMTYQRAGALAATLSGPAGLQPPPALGLTLTSALFPSSKQAFRDCSVVSTAPQHCVSGTPRTAAALFPGQYGAWPGTCADAQPAVLPDQQAVTEAGTTSVALALAGARVQVRQYDAQMNLVPVTGKTVYALHQADTACVTSQSHAMTPAGAADQGLALPQGTWTFALTPDGSAAPAGGWPSRTLATGSVTDVVIVL